MNPLEIEKEFQTLIATIKLIFSHRLRILYIIDFLDILFLKENVKYLNAYSFELIPNLAENITKVIFRGTNISFLKRIERSLNLLNDKVTNQNQKEVLAANIETIKSEINELILLCDERKVNGINSFLLKNRKQKNIFFKSNYFSNQIYIPLVENEKLLLNINSKFGSINNLKINITNPKAALKNDEINFKQLYDKNESSNLVHSLAAAKKLYTKWTGNSLLQKLFVNCWFENNDLVTGESLEAGLTVILFCELLKYYQNKEEFFINKNVAITGKLDENGNLIPLNEEGLKIKLEACFFTEIKFLVIPKGNFEFAELELKKLLDANNKFDPVIICPIQNIEEIFFNRKLTYLKTIPQPVQLSRKIWKYRRVVALIIFLVLIFVIVKTVYGPIDKHPAILDFKGKYLLIKNSDEEVIDKIYFSNEKTLSQFYIQWNCLLIDINDDGYNEVIYLFRNSFNSSDELICFDVKNKKTIWSKVFNYVLNFPEDPVGNTYTILKLKIKDCDLDSKPELYALLANPMYPSILSKMDPKNGNEFSHYIHDGHLHSIDFLNTDNDPELEILLAGINNSFNNYAPVVVLEPDSIKGYSPHKDRHRLVGYKTGFEKYYILIPRTVVGEELADLGVLNSCNCEYIDLKNKIIRITVSEVTFNSSTHYSPIFLNYFFDYHLNPLWVSTSDYYIQNVNILLKEKKISFFPTQKYFQDHFKKIIKFK